MPETTTLRDNSTVADPRLDRLVAFDERSRNFPITAVVPGEIKSHTWGVPGDHLDQGHEGACVGFGVTHELMAYPAAVPGLNATFARERIYWEAQRNDGWEGGSYPGASPQYEGTAVLEGVKVAKSLGYFDEYRWAFSVEDIMRALSHEGPVIVGTNWLEGMDEWSEAGLITAGGEVRGGHCYLLTGITLKPRLKGHSKLGPVFRLRNSWGPDWARGGDAFITVDDFAKLMKDDGEAVIPVGRHRNIVPAHDRNAASFKPQQPPRFEVGAFPELHSDPLRYWRR